MVKAAVLTLNEQATLNEAIVLFERETSAELVVMVARHSDTYVDIAGIWSLLAASLGTWCLWWGDIVRWFPALWMVQALSFLMMLAVLQESGLSAKLAPRALRHKRAAYAAAAQFTLRQVAQTAGRTGILLYVSLCEHYAEIRADRSVSAHVSPMVWETLLQPLLRDLPKDGLAPALDTAIRQGAALIAPCFPPQADDRNELPDTVILV